MQTRTPNRAELRLPAPVLVHLRRVLGEQHGEVAAIHLLHDVGFATGAATYDQLVDGLGRDPVTLAPDDFWEELDDFLHARGWGQIRHERVHPGLGILYASGWVESDPDSGMERPSCAFTAGVLAHLFGRVAQGPIAVLEVECRSRGDEACAFLFGSEEAVQRTYAVLADGEPLERALARV